MRDTRGGGATLLVLVVLLTGASLVSLVQHAQTQRTFALRMVRAEVELEASMLLGLETAMRLLSEHTLAFPEDPFPPVTEAEGFFADNGASIRLTFRDAQDRFDVNWLRSQGVPQESFGHLFRSAGLRGNLRVLDGLTENPPLLESVDALAIHVPDAEEWLAGPLREDLAALPAPASGVLPLNVNAVDADRLVRMLGENLRGWTETVLQMREREPLPDIGGALALLPAPVASALQPYLDVRSSFFEVYIEAEYDSFAGSGQALLSRSDDGTVEVIRCRW
ncbi:MAG: general secretion pathway protein GspK [Verrucomicrobia bacterium]|nr:general secretion pathway protein GspK [Verrucomicrobiota bacterium]